MQMSMLMIFMAQTKLAIDFGAFDGANQDRMQL
jgi:hypothetical protein